MNSPRLSASARREMDIIMVNAPDLRVSPPRRGRELLGGYAFLARMIDKVRAMHAGTIGDYVGYCEMSFAFLHKTGIAKDSFDAIIMSGATDEEVVRFVDAHATAAQKAAANDHLFVHFADKLDEQEADEQSIA